MKQAVMVSSVKSETVLDFILCSRQQQFEKKLLLAML